MKSKKAFMDLKKKTKGMQELVLDLRNPGGLLNWRLKSRTSLLRKLFGS
jgi:C-terminal processing protease CtpA/Prc